MPTIYTRGPARVDITETGGGGPWLALLVVLVVVGAAGAIHRVLHEVWVIVRTILEIVAAGAGTAAAVALAVVAIRAVVRVRRQSVAARVHVITDAAHPALEAQHARLLPDDVFERLGESPYADEAWVRDAQVQGWPGVPREWVEPPEGWPDEWNRP